jgi:hypothetical protein
LPAPPPVRIAIVTDIHHAPDRDDGLDALVLLRAFGDFVAETRPALILDLGDRIADRSPERDGKTMGEVADVFASLPAPTRHVCGNHDLINLSVEDNERILGQMLGHETLDVGAWRIALWRANARLDAEGRFSLGGGDLAWLEATLAASDRPLLVASHVPVSGQSQIGNFHFEENPAGATYPEAASIRRVLRGARQPLVWISGHVHWNSLTFVDGDAHLTQQSLSERFTTWPEPAGAFGLLTLGEAVEWRVFGRDPIEIRLDAARLAARWRPLSSA